MSKQSTWYYGTTSTNSQPWNGGSPLGNTKTCTDAIVDKYISYPTERLSYKVKSCKNENIAIVYDNIEEEAAESSLVATADDHGTSYYYRGDVQDNYLNFAGMCWRIVRIVGDGSIKLVLEDQYTTCDDNEGSVAGADYRYNGNWSLGKWNFGYDNVTYQGKVIFNYLEPKTNQESSLIRTTYLFQQELKSKVTDISSKLKSGDWCLDTSAYSDSNGVNKLEMLDYQSSIYFGSHVRLTSGKTATLKCPTKPLDEFKTVANVSAQEPMYVSSITADEVAYAGGIVGKSNDKYYLVNDSFKSNMIGSSCFYTLSVGYYSGSTTILAIGVRNAGNIDNIISANYNTCSLRPSISLVADTQIRGGNGTIKNPYVVE